MSVTAAMWFISTTKRQQVGDNEYMFSLKWEQSSSTPPHHTRFKSRVMMAAVCCDQSPVGQISQWAWHSPCTVQWANTLLTWEWAPQQVKQGNMAQHQIQNIIPYEPKGWNFQLHPAYCSLKHCAQYIQSDCTTVSQCVCSALPRFKKGISLISTFCGG